MPGAPKQRVAHTIVSHPVKGGRDERGYILKGGWRNFSLITVEPFLCRRFQIKCTRHRVFDPVPVGSFPKALVGAAGRSHSDRTWGKWIHFRQADGRKLGMYLEHQGFGRYSF
jgi:hypothetical protein